MLLAPQVDFGSTFGDISTILAYFLALFRRQRLQFLTVFCFKVYGIHRQLPKVSAVALQLQSADTGWCQALQKKEACISEALPSEACPPYLPASTRGIEMAPFRDSFSVSKFGIIFGMLF